MRSYFQLFFGLLVPLNGLFILVAVLYLKIDYDLTKAMRLGVLIGFLIAVSLSLVLPIFILIMRGSKQTQKNRVQKKHETQTTAMQKALKDTLASIDGQRGVDSQKHIELIDTGIERTIMLLMDKELALDVAYYAISEKKIGTLTENKDSQSHITVKDGEDVVELTITSLTRHTSQVKVRSQPKSVSAKQILTYMKEKEYSFLQY